ncbi:MAG: ABC transporter permease [Deltaproteobacteria bacterium]|nr:ABC transporter permease [Deltaproteobacteria bacterium]
MMLLETIRLALVSVRRNALRSFLTLLGIVIGVAAVIAMVAIGDGAKARVEATFASMGSNMLIVLSGSSSGGGAMGGAGTDGAIHSARVALLRDDLGRLPFLIELSRRTRAVVAQNLVFAVGFIVAGVVITALGLLSPIVALVLHNLADLVIVFNSARLVREGETLA